MFKRILPEARGGTHTTSVPTISFSRDGYHIRLSVKTMDFAKRRVEIFYDEDTSRVLFKFTNEEVPGTFAVGFKKKGKSALIYCKEFCHKTKPLWGSIRRYRLTKDEGEQGYLVYLKDEMYRN